MAVNLPIRIGTRGSPLALAQAREVGAKLAAAHGWDDDAVVVEVIQTSGDAIQDRPLSEVGGKGLFTKELEVALANGRVDIAVHSMKDVPTLLQPGHAIVAVLEREDVRDVLVSDVAKSFDDLSQGAVVGTSSLRRRAQVLALRPDLRIVDFRGNVQTRLRKLSEGVAVATLLARAGLNRLGQTLGTAISTDAFLPAIAQGAVCVEALENRDDLRDALSVLHHETTNHRVTCERAFLRALDGSCRTPIAGLAEISGNELSFRGEVLRPDGKKVLRVSRHGGLDDAYDLGRSAAEELIGEGARDLIG